MLSNEFMNVSEELHPRTWVNVHQISPYDNPVDSITVTAVKKSEHTNMRARSRDASVLVGPREWNSIPDSVGKFLSSENRPDWPWGTPRLM